MREKKITAQNVCFYFLYNVCWDISHAKKKRASYDKNVYWFLCKVPIILIRF